MRAVVGQAFQPDVSPESLSHQGLCEVRGRPFDKSNLEWKTTYAAWTKYAKMRVRQFIRSFARNRVQF